MSVLLPRQGAWSCRGRDMERFLMNNRTLDLKVGVYNSVLTESEAESYRLRPAEAHLPYAL